MNFLQKILLKLSGPLRSFMFVLERVFPYANLAFPIVKELAKLTKNRTLENIASLYEKYHLSQYFTPNVPPEYLIRELARLLMREKLNVTENVVQDRILNAAIELAYNKYKLEEQNTTNVVSE